MTDARPDAEKGQRLDKTSDVYAGRSGSAGFQRHHRQRIHWMCSQVRGPRVLDVGCSQGIVTILLAREGFEVVGVDVESALIEEARQALSAEEERVQARVQFLVADILDPEVKLAAFDTIVAGEILEHLVQPERLIERCRGLLKEEGLLILTVPFGVHPFPDHKRTYYLGSLVQTLSPHFSVERLQLLHVAEGAASPVPLIGVVARRHKKPVATDAPTDPAWLAFLDSATAASEARYVAVVEQLDQRASSLRERVAARDADLKTVRARVSELQRTEAQLKELQALLSRVLDALDEACPRVAAALGLAVPKPAREETLSWRAAQSLTLLNQCSVGVQRLAGSISALEEAQEQTAAQWAGVVNAGHQLGAALYRAFSGFSVDLAEAQGMLAELQERAAALAARGPGEGRMAELGAAVSAFLGAVGVAWSSLRDDVETADREIARLKACERELGEATERATHLTAQLKVGEERLAAAAAEVARLKPCERELGEATERATHLTAQLTVGEERLAAAAAEVVQLRSQLVTSQADVSALRQTDGQLRAACHDRDRAIRQLRRRLGMMETATSYRLGLLIVRSLQRPYRLLLLPFRATAMLARAAVAKLRARGRKPDVPLADLPFELVSVPGPTRSGSPSPGSSGPARTAAQPRPGPAPRAPARQTDETAKLMLSGLYDDPRSVRELTVAAILDEFSLECFRPECRLITFRPDNWRYVLERERPHFLLVESAWKGNGGSWEYRIAQYSYPGREALDELVAWCREAGIQTVFWNKEDPVHFERFLDAARLFDHVFTTDANCLPRYREALGHDRIHALPFAAQPAVHNPIRVPGYRDKTVCFAGSYYANRHVQRREELEWLLDAGMDFGLEIYDRGFGQQGRGAADFSFPDRFRPAIVGGLPYRDIVKAYKQYRVFLNVNSVADSPTMFSRRVFELLACGTAVVSTPALGIEQLLGSDVVQVVRSGEEAREVLKRLLADESLRERLGLAGQRLVAAQHTYAHRLQEVAVKLGHKIEPPAPPPMTAVAWAGREPELQAAVRTVASQQGVEPEILLVCAPDLADSARRALDAAEADKRGRVVTCSYPDDPSAWWKESIAEASGDYLALLVPGDHYGPHYLADLARALTYSRADVVGKSSYYSTEAGSGLVLMNEGHDLIFTDAILPATLLGRREVIADLALSPSSLHDSRALVPLAASGVRVFSADRFNYVRCGASADCASVDI